MADLALWLTAQLDEDERIALKSVEQAMVNLAGADADSVADWHVVERPATGTFVATRDQWDRVTEIVPTYGGAHSEHIAEHDPARVLREIAVGRELLAEYERLLRAHAAHKAEAARMAEVGDDDPTRIAALRREADYLPAMLHVMERWAKQKAAVYAQREGYAEAVASAD